MQSLFIKLNGSHNKEILHFLNRDFALFFFLMIPTRFVKWDFENGSISAALLQLKYTGILTFDFQPLPSASTHTHEGTVYFPDREIKAERRRCNATSIMNCGK